MTDAVKRFSPCGFQSNNEGGCDGCVEDSEGDYVLATAHDAVVAERDALKAENARLSMEMESYRSKLTPQDAAAMQAVMDALYAEKTRAALRTGDEGDGNGT